MKISLNSVGKVLHEFIQTSLVPKVNSPFQFILSLGNCYLEDLVLGNKLTEFYSNYFRVLEALGILENNQIDIDKLKLNSLKALQSCNGKVEIPLYGNKLYSLKDLKKWAGESDLQKAIAGTKTAKDTVDAFASLGLISSGSKGIKNAATLLKRAEGISGAQLIKALASSSTYKWTDIIQSGEWKDDRLVATFKDNND